KDTGFLVQRPGTRLYQGRWMRVAVRVRDGRLARPAVDLHAVLPESSVAVCELPQLAFDGGGRLWTFFRRRTARNPRIDGWAAQGIWELYATSWDGTRWSVPFALARGTGRNDMRTAFSRDAAGTLWAC